MTIPARLPDRWQTRDFPVLIEAARDLDEPGDQIGISTETISKRLGVEVTDVDRAVGALTQAGYLARDEITFPGGPSFGSFLSLTERGRRAVGLWPSGDDVDALLDALRQAEDAVTDPEEKTILRRATGALAMVSRDVMVDIVAALAARQAGIG